MKGNSRTISNRGGKKIIGSFASRKTGNMIRWESQLERDYIYHLEMDADVRNYVSQPESFIYKQGDGQERKYTPDFWVLRFSCEELVEVKPFEKTMESEFQDKIKIITSVAKEKGYHFKVVTEKEIVRNPYLENLKMIYRYSRFDPDIYKRETCLRYFRNENISTVQEALNYLSNQGIGVETLYQLIGRGDLWIDLNQQIVADSAIRLHP